MKRLMITSLIILLSGCGYEHTDPELIRNTAPGANLPGAFAHCKQYDDWGRCRDWSNKVDVCVNPKGMDQAERLVSCPAPE